MTPFSPTRHASPTPHGMAVTVEPEQLPAAYAWLSARLLPEFDRQLTIHRAAHTAWFLNTIWPYRTGRSVRSWAMGIGHIPEANNPPGPRPTFSVEDARRKLSEVKPGDMVYHANAARRENARSSYVQGLWEGRFSPQLPSGAEKPLSQYHRSIEKAIVRQAETAAIEEAL